MTAALHCARRTLTARLGRRLEGRARAAASPHDLTGLQRELGELRRRRWELEVRGEVDQAARACAVTVLGVTIRWPDGQAPWTTHVSALHVVDADGVEHHLTLPAEHRTTLAIRFTDYLMSDVTLAPGRHRQMLAGQFAHLTVRRLARPHGQLWTCPEQMTLGAEQLGGLPARRSALTFPVDQQITQAERDVLCAIVDAARRAAGLTSLTVSAASRPGERTGADVKVLASQPASPMTRADLEQKLSGAVRDAGVHEQLRELTVQCSGAGARITPR